MANYFMFLTLQIISVSSIDDYIVVELLTATTLPELDALPNFDILPTRHRARRGTYTFSPSVSFSIKKEKQVSYLILNIYIHIYDITIIIFYIMDIVSH